MYICKQMRSGYSETWRKENKDQCKRVREGRVQVTDTGYDGGDRCKFFFLVLNPSKIFFFVLVLVEDKSIKYTRFKVRLHICLHAHSNRTEVY